MKPAFCPPPGLPQVHFLTTGGGRVRFNPNLCALAGGGLGCPQHAGPAGFCGMWQLCVSLAPPTHCLRACVSQMCVRLLSAARAHSSLHWPLNPALWCQLQQRQGVPEPARHLGRPQLAARPKHAASGPGVDAGEARRHGCWGRGLCCAALLATRQCQTHSAPSTRVRRFRLPPGLQSMILGTQVRCCKVAGQ